jgi:GT2 family glycosyltransferase/2-polyprenyl-3-methyl-5-hydroxy-6-metoxy-1,4-benzoquinol methylase
LSSPAYIDDGPEVGLIDAVFLTSNSRDQALECLAHLQEPDVASVVVVDNASDDGTSHAVRTAHPDVTVVALEKPVGMAAALNRGASLGRAPFVLYLNDDVFAAPGSVRILLRTLQESDEAVAAGGRLVNEDLTTQDQYRPRNFPSPKTVVARLLGLERLWPRNPWTGSHLRRPLDEHTTVAVDQPAGACILVRRSIAERIGGWDERYWFWYEDVDFCRRLAREGSLLYVPAAPFRHVGGATARRLRRVDGHRRNFHGALIYADSHFAAPGRTLIGVTLAVIGMARALRAAPSDRYAARIYADVVRASMALLLRRHPVGLQATTSTSTEPRAVTADQACPVCGTPSTITHRFQPTVLAECGNCRLRFRPRIADREAVLRMYSDDSYSAERMSTLTLHRMHDAAKRARWVRERTGGRRLLEIGAGTGFFVAQAARHGFHAIGIEPSDLAAGYARTRLGVDVRTGFLDTSDLPEKDFDVVCMWHVLEHATDPLALLSGARDRLQPAGRLIMEVPNIESVGADMLRGRWAHLDQDAHVCHFSPRSLTTALQSTGFALVELQTLVEGYYDRPLLRLRPRRIAGRVIRAVRLRSPSLTHPSRGELLRVIATPRS